jgi:aldehyde dehydrogenase (NAD+)
VSRQGQSCTAGSRLYLHRNVHDKVLARLAERLGALTVGDPLDEASDIGAVINQSKYDAIRNYLEEGLANPAMRVELGGLPPTTGPLAEGFFHVRTLSRGATTASASPGRRFSAPWSSPSPGPDVDDVVRMANDSAYGRAAFVWSRDVDEALTTAHRLEAGWVEVNQGGGQVVGQSYGGYKQSGVGREVSLEGMIAAFTQTKQINVRLGSGATSTPRTGS